MSFSAFNVSVLLRPSRSFVTFFGKITYLQRKGIGFVCLLSLLLNVNVIDSGFCSLWLRLNS